MKKRTQIDREGLAEELLDLAKTHMRVEFTRDDDYIKLALRRAIDFFERITELNVFGSQWDWVPEQSVSVDGVSAYILTWQPAPSFKAFTNDVAATEVTDQFAIFGDPEPDGFGMRWISPVVTPEPATPLFKITAGYADADSMPPGILSFVLEAASWFYEYREAGPMPGADGVAYLNQLLTAYWVPRV